MSVLQHKKRAKLLNTLLFQHTPKLITTLCTTQLQEFSSVDFVAKTRLTLFYPLQALVEVWVAFQCTVTAGIQDLNHARSAAEA
jgi:hypothetical protein